jgi:aspartyl protease family protein
MFDGDTALVSTDMIRLIFILSLLCFAINVHAIEKIEVQGLFSNKAVLLIDGVRHILAVGKTSPEGVKVISANSRGAVLEVDGQQKQYSLGNTVSTNFAVRKNEKETIYKNSGGMFMTIGSINGRSVHFLIDTGASAIAMNVSQAKNLGIRYDKIGTPASVSTASGFTKAYRVHLKSVSVGGIMQKNVEAFVIDGNHPGPVLLGMTFLGRLNVEHSGNAMTLLQKD